MDVHVEFVIRAIVVPQKIIKQSDKYFPYEQNIEYCLYQSHQCERRTSSAQPKYISIKYWRMCKRSTGQHLRVYQHAQAT